MRVIHLTTWQERCGIASYAEDLVSVLRTVGGEHTVHPIKPSQMRYYSDRQTRDFFGQFVKTAAEHDLVHIQHEFSFFDGRGRLRQSVLNFARLITDLRRQGTPVLVTFHTEPEFALKRVGMMKVVREPGIATRQLYDAYLWRKKVARQFVEGGRMRAIVHTKKSRLAFTESGMDVGAIDIVPLGIKERRDVTALHSPSEAKRLLGYAPDCKLLALFGFLARYKGGDLAIKALQLLPEQYHLALIGGAHPEDHTSKTLDRLVRFTESRPSLASRVRITGYVEHDLLDLYHAATDVCLAPYRNVNLSSSAAITMALTSGKPVIASKIPAFTEINESAECMLLCTDSAYGELAWSIRKLMSDQAMQSRLVANARKFAANNSVQVVGQRTFTIYEGLRGMDGRSTPLKTGVEIREAA
jgi:glycosyltransferase involved in cell wall biosynthesis